MNKERGEYKVGVDRGAQSASICVAASLRFDIIFLFLFAINNDVTNPATFTSRHSAICKHIFGIILFNVGRRYPFRCTYMHGEVNYVLFHMPTQSVAETWPKSGSNKWVCGTS